MSSIQIDTKILLNWFNNIKLSFFASHIKRSHSIHMSSIQIDPKSLLNWFNNIKLYFFASHMKPSFPLCTFNRYCTAIRYFSSSTVMQLLSALERKLQMGDGWTCHLWNTYDIIVTFHLAAAVSESESPNLRAGSKCIIYQPWSMGWRCKVRSQWSSSKPNFSDLQMRSFAWADGDRESSTTLHGS